MSTISKDWDAELPGCFGTTDFHFAGHKLDENRAFSWLGLLRDRGATQAEVEKQIRAFLKGNGVADAQTDDELFKVQRLFYPWLSTD